MKVTRLLPGAEAEIVCSAPPPPSQQGGRNLHQPPRGNKNRHRTGSGSHPPASSSFPPHSEEQGAGVRKMGETLMQNIKTLSYIIIS